MPCHRVKEKETDMSKPLTTDDVERYIAERRVADGAAAAGTPPASMPPMENFVLYISKRADDRGSERLLQLIEPVHEDFRVVDVASLEKESLPEWLDGTPIVVDVRTENRAAHKGTQALELVLATYPVCRSDDG